MDFKSLNQKDKDLLLNLIEFDGYNKSNGLYNCPHCRTKNLSFLDIETHINEAHDGKMFKNMKWFCKDSQCNAKFTSFNQAVAHILSHKENKNISGSFRSEGNIHTENLENDVVLIEATGNTQAWKGQNKPGIGDGNFTITGVGVAGFGGGLQSFNGTYTIEDHEPDDERFKAFRPSTQQLGNEGTFTYVHQSKGLGTITFTQESMSGKGTVHLQGQGFAVEGSFNVQNIQ